MIYPSNAERKKLPVEEAMSSIRPNLHALLAQFVQAAEENERHRVMFVSPEHGDGTTTIAASAALMLVRHFRRDVGLVEANLYSPAMAAYLGIPAGPGLLDYADGAAEAVDTVRNSKLHGLYVLTAGGNRRPMDGELAGSEMRDLIAEASSARRFSIIDAPPLLEYPETCLLLEHVDEVILVIRAGSTYAKRAQAAIQIVKDAGVQVGGIFLNRFRSNLPFGMGRFGQD